MNGKVRTIVEGAEIPSVPDVLQRILLMAGNPSSSGGELEKLILQEPGLVTHILKTVNSAYYAFGSKVNSVKQAIFLLGLSTVRSIASGLALIDAFNNLPGLNREYVLQVWTHSLSCAGLVKVLSERKVPREKQDGLFTAAMVHNVGHIVMTQYFQGDYDALSKENSLPLAEDEKARFDVDHAEIGAALLEKWRFTPDIVDLVRYHHQPKLFEGEEEEQAILLFVVVSDMIARKGEALSEFMDLEESEVDAGFLEILGEVGWGWEELQGSRDIIQVSIDGAKQILPH